MWSEISRTISVALEAEVGFVPAVRTGREKERGRERQRVVFGLWVFLSVLFKYMHYYVNALF